MGLLNRGLSAAGYGAAQLGLEGFRASLEQDKIRLADQLAGVREAATDTRREDIRRAGKQADINLETSDDTVAKKGRAASGLINATLPAEVERGRTLAQSTIDVNTDPANVRKAIDKLNAMAPAEAKVKRDAMIAELEAKATPEALMAARQVARATNIESAASVAQANLANLSAEEKRRTMKLQDEYLKPETSKERKDAIHTELNVLAGKRDDLMKLRVKVGEDSYGKPIMEDVLIDAKTRKRIDITGGGPPPVPTAQDKADFEKRKGDPKFVAAYRERFGAVEVENPAAATPDAPAESKATGMINTPAQSVQRFTPEEQSLIDAAKSPAEKSRVTREIIRQQMEDAENKRKAKASAESAAGVAEYERRGVDVNAPAFQR